MRESHVNLCPRSLAALAAIVLVAWFSQPPDAQVAYPNAQKTAYPKEHHGPAEGRWLPEFSARDTYAQWVMAVLALAATAVSIWAVQLVRETLQETRRATEGQNRAWLSLDCTITRLAETQTQAEKTGIYLNVGAISHNYGHSPATHVSFHAEIALLGETCPVIEDRLRSFCDTIKKNADRAAEAVFPDKADNLSHTVFLSHSDIDAELARRSSFPMIAPIIYGCVNYKSPFTKGVRQTQFAFSVCTVRDGQAFVLMPDRPDWLGQPLYLVRPGLITAD